jgi:HD superfamily phosphohydrolase
MTVVHGHVAVEQSSKEQKALAAALVHDLGHGPFSHAFEKVGKRLGLQLADHEAMSDALIRDGEVAKELTDQFGRGFADEVADIIKKDGVKSVEHAVVSSQFDADRLDYIRRDRMMTGTQHAAIDFTWLIANLEIGSVAIGVDDTQVGTIETFVIGPKAIHAAEAFVLGLFQLYPTVYFHKATRGAEKIFTELLVQLVTLVRGGNVSATGLPVDHPLVRFANSPEDINVALALDDAVVWGALSQMSAATDPLISEFSVRLRDRQLYKCHDIRTSVAAVLDPKSGNTDDAIELIDKCCAEIGTKLTDWTSNSGAANHRILIDKEERSPYKSVTESKGPLDRINVRSDAGAPIDLKERSSVVAALKTYKLFRAYADRADTEAQDAIRRIVEGEIETCRKQTP